MVSSWIINSFVYWEGKDNRKNEKEKHDSITHIYNWKLVRNMAKCGIRYCVIKWELDCKEKQRRAVYWYIYLLTWKYEEIINRSN